MVDLADYYTVGGHVYASPFPIDDGYAYLYKMEDGNPEAVDTAVIDTLGFYYFYAVIEGDYIIKSRLRDNSVHYGNFIPTYFGHSYNWQNATVITHNKENFNYHIHLIDADGTKEGSGAIKGQITYDTNTITSDYTPAEDIEIILMDGESICLTCKLSDLEGFFRFQDIRYGTYQIFAEVTGIENEPMFITISEDTPGNEEIVNVVIQEEQIMFGIAEPQSDMFHGNLVFRPNPFFGMGQLDLEINEPGSFRIHVVDMKGSIVDSRQHTLSRGQHSIVIDISRQPAGLYHILVEGSDRSVTPLKVIKQ
jgi:hypothetical protein